MAFDLPRVHLAHLPTPLEELPRLSERLGGPHLLIKRDDLTALAHGGNKTRKLEYLMADALRQGAQTVITTGSVQSNHARQTAAAAAHLGLRCILVLSPKAPGHWNGNLLLDRLLGASLRWSGERDPYTVMEEIAAEEQGAGRRPYIIPAGGANAIGAAAYVLAMQELLDQASRASYQVNHIVLASSTGGTQAGLVVGAEWMGYEGQITGISVAQPREELARRVINIAGLSAALLGIAYRPQPDRLSIVDDYLGEGYGMLGQAERCAIRLTAECEGLLLDPVYTGRAMAGLMDRIARGLYSPEETVVFWHTGGDPALFAYSDALLSP